MICSDFYKLFPATTAANSPLSIVGYDITACIGHALAAPTP
jgi:hypothetical protein